MSTPIKWRHAPRDHEHDIEDVTGLATRLAALEYDSEPRNITGLIRPGYTVGSAVIHRVGRTVTLTFELLTPEAAGAGFPFNSAALPAGLRPVSDWPFQGVSTSGATARFAVRPGYGIGIYGAAAGASYFGTVTYLVPAALPTTLPGDPA